MNGHGDPWDYIDGLREDLNRTTEDLHRALERIDALEKQTPGAQRLQHEADIAAADLAESGYGEPW